MNSNVDEYKFYKMSKQVLYPLIKK